jgi:hypothetical protein
MEDIRKLYYAALANEGMTELSDESSKAKFNSICQRVIEDNPNEDFEKKVKAAHYYLQMLLLHPYNTI